MAFIKDPDFVWKSGFFVFPKGHKKQQNKVFEMKISMIYPLLSAKVEKKNRTKQGLDEIICWLIGYDRKGLQEQLDKEACYLF